MALSSTELYSGFMIQGGCPDGTGMGGPGWQYQGRVCSQRRKERPEAHRGASSPWTRSTMPDSAGSQFFIMHEDAPYLDGQYAAFGKVIEGMDVVDEIAYRSHRLSGTGPR